MKRPMLKTHRGGKPKKLPSEGPHPKSSSITPEWAIKTAEESARHENEFSLDPVFVLDSLGGTPETYDPFASVPFQPVPAVPLRITIPMTIEPKGRTFGDLTYDAEGMGARVPHIPCLECVKATKEEK